MNTALALNIQPGSLKKEFEEAYASINNNQVTKRLFDKDATLWKTDTEQIAKIDNRLGWLTLPQNADALIEFSNKVKIEGFKHAVLIGMGGSSLCSEVARETFGTTNGFLQLLVLDNTAPSAILNVERQIDVLKTLFIVASKSGNTMETLSFFHYFYSELQKKGIAEPGNNFVAITDAGTPLVDIAKKFNFKETFINPGDIGGRYSVLSNFGLVPMALMGIDIKAMLKSAQLMKDNCSQLLAETNPGVGVGAALGAAQKQARDKVTFVLSPSLKAFGYWVEQLIAESTGKEGTGLIPVAGETLGAPQVYQNDRVFIHLFLAIDNDSDIQQKLNALESAGHLVINIELADKLDLGGEYYRWEVATAIAGHLMNINPFDEPNVAEGKKNTNDLIDEWRKSDNLKLPVSLLSAGNISIYGNDEMKTSVDQAESLKDFLAGFFDPAVAGNYIALLAYFEETDKRTEILQSIRMQLRDKLKVATTLGYGPRYLHSTGQLHKGGTGTGIYLIITEKDIEQLEIPDEEFTFDVLNRAQSLGDFRSLNDKGRRVIYIQAAGNIVKGLEEILESVNSL